MFFKKETKQFFTAQPRVWSFAVFFLLFLVALGLSEAERTAVFRQQELQFRNQTDQISAFIQSRMDLHINAVYGAQGLFAASVSVERGEWAAYIAAIDVPKNFSGISSLSYLPRVRYGERFSFPYTVYPNPAPGADTYPLLYSVVFDATSSPVFGFDFGSEKNRALAFRLAVEESRPAATPVVPSAANGEPVVSVYAPVYINGTRHNTKEDRMKNLAGFIAAGFRVKTLFDDLSGHPVFSKGMGLRLYDRESPDIPLYENAPDGGFADHRHLPRLFQSAEISVAGRIWRADFSAPDNYDLAFAERFAATGILSVGIFLAAFLSLFMYSLLTSRQRAIAYADEATRDLKKANAKLETSKQDAVARASELERINAMMVDREIKMMELKEELKKYRQ